MAAVHGAQVVVCPVVEFRLANFERHRVPCSIRLRAEGIERDFVATARTPPVHWTAKGWLGEG